MLNVESSIIRGNFQSGIRIPPQDIEAEKALLGSVMQQPQMMYEVTDFLNERCFYVEKHRLIWKVIMELFAKNEPLDLLSLSSRLREKNMLDQVGGASYLAELVECVPSASNAEHYAKIVQKKYLLRNLISASEQVGHLGYSEELDLDELLDRAEKIVFGVTANNNQRRFLSIKDTLTEAWERLDHLHKTKEEVRGVPTGFIELDNRLAGLQKSDLVILAARPSMGKTSLALDIARHTACKHNTPVGIFSLEMSSQQLVDRMLAAESKVDSWKLRTGRLSTDQEFSLIRDSLDKLSKAPIFIDDDSTNNIIKMRSVARRLKSEHGLGLIIVDYLQLMVPHRQVDSLVQQVTEISRSLKSLARELEVPVLALSQLNRNVEQRGGEPRLSDLRDSGSIEQDADVVMFIHREDKYDKDSEKPNIAKIIIAKHRNGPTGMTELYFDEKRTSFVSIDKSNFGEF